MDTSPPFQDVQTLLLQRPRGPAVAHLILQIPAGLGAKAASLLLALQQLHLANPRLLSRRIALSVDFGPQPPRTAVQGSIGVTYQGLRALGVPQEYLQVFHGLAPAFAEGAPARRTKVGDGVANRASASAAWPDLTLERAHVVLSLHGSTRDVRLVVKLVSREWRTAIRLAGSSAPFVSVIEGHYLEGPNGAKGRWAHFGYRDDVSDIAIYDRPKSQQALDERRHEPGVVLLGHANDANVNRWMLSRAPELVRKFFHDSSFGVLRPAMQDIAAFEAAVAAWLQQTQSYLRSNPDAPKESAAFKAYFEEHAPRLVRAKLLGRWPNGQRIEPGQFGPVVTDLGQYALVPRQRPRGDFSPIDDKGEGCPFNSHVGRLHSAQGDSTVSRPPPLLRRSVPYGPATWDGRPNDKIERGHIGHFFCADIENQFETLVANWAASPPRGSAADDRALDPLIGPQDDVLAGLRVPLKGVASETFTNFQTFVRPRSMVYAWYPSRSGLRALLEQDFVPKEDRGPWL